MRMALEATGSLLIYFLSDLRDHIGSVGVQGYAAWSGLASELHGGLRIGVAELGMAS